ncbi:biotin transporter BioY [Bacillus velezensis]|uniref:biotin transporter BioY n=1 Tax=Bacillus TaxID=1386 RepID=UPI000B92DA80|nr:MULTISPECIES: biotin transporter BioY [Bacillus amyloliquefaciens group]ASS61675.1 putative biotin transporter BioY [Bacillus velezensis]ATC52351.1 putative biotin transporter BioY [Bacillus velezensis]MCW5192704.1 putative biotin transporter BioY [Bacillus amyloliquefaciens]QOC80706.1 biotin transporter BioY [Bacillus velezensis]QPK90049.1 biotin transporter BioY [Bacillus velezensis]
MKLTEMMHIAVFTAIMGLLGLLPPLFLSFTPVPITLQTIGVLLSGSILKPKAAFLSQLLFLLIVACGAPLLSGGRGGFGVFFGPSAGYLIAYPLAALLLSLSTQGLRSAAVPHLFIRQFLFGVLFLYVIGIPVQAFIMHIDILTAVKLSLIYVPGDLLKAAAASFAAVRIRKTLQASRLLPTKGS